MAGFDRPLQQEFARPTGNATLRRRCARDARRHNILSQRADTAGDCADCAGATCGNATHQPAEFSDADRLQGGTHGVDGAGQAACGLRAAPRASYIAGFTGTATVLAGMQFGIPLFGTMAHSFVQAHADETLAFKHFAHAQPDNIVLLIDTYDTEAAARKVVALAPQLEHEGIRITGVRIDSGNLTDHAYQVRQILDAGGLKHVTIFASGDLDEHVLRDMLAAGAPVDGFGIGTRMDTSSDVPYLDCAYKLQEYAGKARRKRSEGKQTWPGRKQVYRNYNADGRMSWDIVTLEEDIQPGEPLLKPVMRGGRRLAAAATLEDVRRHAAASLARLPESLRNLQEDHDYRVDISPALHELAEQVDQGSIYFE